jgi:UDP-glucose 4-epimerase
VSEFGFEQYAGRRVCVTGGAGFIGSHLVDALVGHGAEVRVLDDLSAGLRANLTQVEDEIRFTQGTILNPQALDAVFEGVHTVYHLAALTSVPRSVVEPELYMQVNALGTMNVLEAAVRAGVQRVVFAASSSAYGDAGGDCKHETVRPDPQSIYAVAKCTGEQMMIAYGHCHGLQTVSLRYFNIFGPRQLPDSAYAAVVPRFSHALITGGMPVIYGDGTQTRDFTHVANAVHANLLAGVCPKDCKGPIVNVACGVSASVIDLLHEIAQRLNMEPRHESQPPRVGEVMHSMASVQAAKDLLGYEPVVSMADGLDDAVAWYAKAYG